MLSLKGRHLYALGLILCTLELQYITAITPQSLHQLSPIIEQKQPPPPAPSSVIRQSIDTKAKLVGINRALHERLQQTRANLRPLQARAAQLQHRFDEYQRTAGARRPPSSGLAARGARTERNQLLQEAHRLRAAVERKLQGFGALDQRYRSMRTLLEPKTKSAGLPRAWLDRDTERQMELNERIYKNIIDLLVHLIECPVNIIHDVMGHDVPADGPTTTTAEPPFPPDSAQEVEEGTDTDGNTLYDEPVELNADIDDTVPWLEEFHY
ncbi:uncharacterized protein LOC120898357 [Anopheles arabiensis]|uniref:Uncharacterized protein n=1 Tax=Anopheles arabiensis TaxID=7173 RepID=A0A182HTY8_ANOAR|nr:uncharacterized protein LOC120898357 [Anopheles arabiensis]